MNTRIERLAATLLEDQAALILSESNRFYYTGFEADAGALWVTADDACFLTDFRYIEAARNGVRGVACRESSYPFADSIKALKERGIRQLLLEDETVTVRMHRQYVRQADGIELDCDHTLCHTIACQRRFKDAQEIACIEAAQAITDDGFSYILSHIGAGRTERDIALDLEMYMRRQGAKGLSFDIIAASGENGALPHAVPTDRVLQKGDLITLDFGVKVGGYCSDMTRTVAIGAVSDEQRQVYDIVLGAQRACLAGIRAGLSGMKADALARSVIEQAGYGAAFGHSTGHGVGIDIHERPTLSPRADCVLGVGDVVTVEPGIYLEGRFGVRIEDMVLITESGCRNFTKSEKQLISL